MENDQWPSARTLGHTIYDEDVLKAAGMAPQSSAASMDLFGLHLSIGMSVNMRQAVDHAVECFIKSMHELYTIHILKTSVVGPNFKQEVQAVMAKIRDVSNGNIRSKLRDEVVFVTFIKHVEHTLAHVASDPEYDVPFDQTKLRELVVNLIRRLFSKKIQDVSLDSIVELPLLEHQERLYKLLVPQLKTAHESLKSL